MLGRLGQFHENERLNRWVQTGYGRIAVWMIAVALLAWHETSIAMIVAFSAVLLVPRQRRLLLSLAAAGTIAERLGNGEISRGISEWLLLGAKLAVALAGLYVIVWLVRRAEKWPALVQRYPATAVHVALWLGYSLSWLPGLGVLTSLPFFAWRLSYLAASGARGTAKGTRFRDHLFYLAPVFGGEATPIGKGFDYLTRHEANDGPSLARSQLAGIKLLLLAVVWVFALAALKALAQGDVDSGRAELFGSYLSSWSIGIPNLDELLRATTTPAWHTSWAALYVTLVTETLSLAIFGHVVVGCLRLLGFNVFRNTYKPLLAESIVEFWNRFFYYFKEVLVDFFFYPTYLRLKRLKPAARTFAAVFAAAFVGNMYFHIFYESPDEIFLLDLATLWALWGPRLIYCLLLAIGIWLSMLRQQKLRAAGVPAGGWTRARRIAGVWTFYAVLQIWNIRLEDVTIGDCNALFLALFGLSVG